VASQLFRFAQIEVPWPFGPDDGRYVVRRHAGEQPEHVLVLATLGAPQRRLLRGKRAKNAEPEPDPTPVPTGRATIIPAAPLETEKDAARWLKDADGETEIEAALVVLNRALHAHRVALADPHAREVGRDAALACELLVLRARADLDAGRQREAALQLRVALDTALAELPAWAERGDLPARIKELAGFVDPAAAVAATALERGLDPDEAEEIGRILGRLEAALRARTAAGFA